MSKNLNSIINPGALPSYQLPISPLNLHENFFDLFHCFLYLLSLQILLDEALLPVLEGSYGFLEIPIHDSLIDDVINDPFFC